MGGSIGSSTELLPPLVVASSDMHTYVMRRDWLLGDVWCDVIG